MHFVNKLSTSLQRMKYLLATVLMITAIKGNAQNADAILGEWESIEKNLIVEVYKQGNDFRARIVWFYDEADTITPIQQRLDIKNPDKILQSRKIIGADILSGLTYNPKQNKWTGGRIYDATSGKTWDATVWLTDYSSLSVRGFYLVRWFGKTLYFTRVQPQHFSE